MSTIKADAVTTKSDNTDLVVTGGGSGVPDIEAGFKVGGSAGVPTASIQDDAVTLAKLAAGTDGELITWDASGDPAAVAVGTATHVLTSNGAGAAPTFQAAGGGFTLGTELGAGGTAKTFSSIPSGTTIIYMNLEGISISSADNLLVTLGDAGGLETSGYISTSVLFDDAGSPNQTSSTSGFIMRSDLAAQNFSGQIVLTLKDSSNYTWICSYVTKAQTNRMVIGAGQKSLSAELTQLSLSGGTFDEGSINIMYQ